MSITLFVCVRNQIKSIIITQHTVKGSIPSMVFLVAALKNSGLTVGLAGANALAINFVGAV